MRFLVPFLLALWIILPAWAEVLEGRVVAVADGNTITLLDSNQQQHRIRLAGIDAPEKAQTFGQRSKQHLSELAYGKEAKADCYKVDCYDPDVCTV
jgi:endonuclease YncB( thermonuclease family)